MRELLDLALQVLAWRERSMSTMLERLQQLVDGKLPRPPIADRSWISGQVLAVDGGLSAA